MSIIQISKIQQRSGDLVDLPQLDEAEFGFASDEKRLFIGKTIGAIENVEVLTAYSEIAFSQIDGAIGNLDIQDNVANGEILVFDGNNWTNRGGNTGGYINLGDAGNVSIMGGSLGYQLVTDGAGNLSWSPKGYVTLNILNVTKANPGVVQFTDPFPLTTGTQVTINNIEGNTGFTALNANDFFLKPIAGNSSIYELYTDSFLTTPYNTTALNPAFPFTTATFANSVTDEITVGNSVSFNVNDPVYLFGNLGTSGLQANTTYYVYAKGDSTHIQLSTSNDGNVGNRINLQTSSLSANIYVPTGEIVIAVGGGLTAAAGSNTQIQFNYDDVLAGAPNLTYNFDTNTTIAGTLVASDFTVTTSANLGSNANVYIGGGSPEQVLTTDGLGNLYWSTPTGGGGNAWPGYYLHTQSAASNSWTVIHNLNTEFVDVTPIFANSISMTGHYNYPDVTYVNANAVTLTFSSAITGYVSVTGDSGNLDNYYLHNQAAASTTWTVNHNLNTQYVSVSPAAANNESWIGKYDFPSIVYTNANSLTLTFSSAQSGDVAVVGSSSMDGYYLHTQSSASTTWVVDHNLGSKYLCVTPIDASNISYVGRYDYPEITYNNNNTLTLTFSSPVSGRAVVIGGTGVAQTAGGANTEVQYNNNGSLDGDPSFTFNQVTNVVTINQLQTANISAGSSSTQGNLTGNWILTSGSRLQATYADLAEYYDADKPYTPGTVVEFGGDKEITQAGPESNKIAGVISSEPAYVMNGDIQAEHPAIVALLGRVKVKVVGYVSKGDMLVSAGNGFAKTSILTPKIGTVIGKAIENKNDTGEGYVEVLVGRL